MIFFRYFCFNILIKIFLKKFHFQKSNSTGSNLTESNPIETKLTKSGPIESNQSDLQPIASNSIESNPVELNIVVPKPDELKNICQNEIESLDDPSQEISSAKSIPMEETSLIMADKSTIEVNKIEIADKSNDKPPSSPPPPQPPQPPQSSSSDNLTVTYNALFSFVLLENLFADTFHNLFSIHVRSKCSTFSVLFSA